MVPRRKPLRKRAAAALTRVLPRALRRAAVPPVGRVDLGDFGRTKPFSDVFGFDRGGPVDRYYIDRFLGAHAADVKGRVLEVGDDAYTVRFGGAKVERRDILHIDASNPKATFVGDLATATDLPSDAFDAIVLTQVLQFVYDVHGALRTCQRVLKPGGVLLATVPGISQLDRGEWASTWYWAFTDVAMRRMASESFPGGRIDVTTHGNVFAAAAFLYGMGAPELPKTALDAHDPAYQVLVTVRAQKALA